MRESRIAVMQGPKALRPVCMRLAVWLLAGAAVLDAAPRQLRVAYGKAPPMVDIDSSGRPGGFAVETMTEAARRAGISLAWQVGSTPEGNNKALLEGKLDLILGPATPERRKLFFVTEPWWSSEIVALSAAASSIKAQGDINGRRIALAPGAGAVFTVLQPLEPVLNTGSAVQAAEAVCAGTADAAVFAAMYLREILAAAPHACEGTKLRTIDISATIDYVLTGRRQDYPILERLKTQLDDLTADGTLTAIAARNPPMSTPQATRLEETLRVRYESRALRILFAAVFVVGFLVAIALFRLHRSRQRLAESNQLLAADLEARVKVEKALRESELRFRAVLDSAPQTVLAVDGGGIITFANAKTEAMFGYNPGDLAGKHISMMFPPVLAQGASTDWWRGLGAVEEGSTAAPRALVGVKKDGSEFPVDVAYGAVPVGGSLVIVFIQDTSERLELERQLRESQKLESIGQLAGGVAHDFNNLLTVIHGYVDVMLDELPRGSGMRESAAKIAQASTKAAALTRQLLTFSRRQVAEPRALSLNDLVTHFEGMLRPLIRENINLTLVLRASHSWIHADPGQIEQVLINLVVNARDAMPDGGHLTVETSNPDGVDTIVLSVEDNGTGMTSDVQARIFDPFFTTKEKGKGTGLGLSVVYGIVQQSRASIAVRSEPGQGTRIEIRFPAAQREPVPAEVERPPGPALARTGSGTVLLAEDEPGVREFVAGILRHNGYTVLAAANGREAQELMDKCGRPIDLLLTDTIMPEVGGVALSRKFAARYPGTPILRMTGYADGEDYGDPRIPLISKPFTAPALLDLVREIIAARGPSAGAARSGPVSGGGPVIA